MFKNHLQKIVIEKKGIVLKCSNAQRKVLFSEMKTIYIQINKSRPIPVFICASGFFLVLTLSFWTFGVKLIVVSPLLIALYAGLKWCDFKNYILVIVLANGGVLRHSISLNRKHIIIDSIRIVKKKLARATKAK